MFVHLHVHSHYSLLDGLPKIPELVLKAKEFDMPAVALTDHGALYGAIEFYKTCKEYEIKPILGMEAYLSPHSLKSPRAKTERTRYHLTLLAKNFTGYKNLMKLSTIGWLKGFYYKPRIDKIYLKKYGEGLIILSGCFQSEINQLLLAPQEKDKACELVEFYQALAGKDNFYLEIQHHPEMPEYLALRPHIIEIADKLKIPMVATNDVHYLKIEDKTPQDVLLCIQTNKKLEDENRMSMVEADIHFASPKEMREKFADIKEATENTLRIAEQVHVDIPLRAWQFPSVEIPRNVTPDAYLKELTYSGIEERLLRENVHTGLPPAYAGRIEYELDIIKAKGYAPYFLVVADIVAFARSSGIITTTRGSAAGSLVSYAIGITTADPMNFALPFERFLNPDRPSPPDIDLDIEDARREEVIQYVTEKYGKDKVAHIITFGTLLARAAIRDVGRVLNLPYSFCDKLAKMIPLGSQGFKMTLNRAMEENLSLKQLYQENEDVRQAIDIAREIEGCVRHPSQHAAGIVIAPTTLTDFIPLHRDPAKGTISTQYDMHAVEDVGLLKMDLLGITNLSILGLARTIIKKIRGIELDLNKLPLDDQKTYTLLTEGKTMGIFQLSGSGMTRYLKELQPTNIFDIMAMISLYRPGPMESIPEYIRRKRNPALVSYPHPKLEPILKKSYGIITYQDDVLLTAIELAGYNWEEADKLRKAIGKKIPKEMAKQKTKFISGCIKYSNTSAEEAARIWRLIEPFAAYGFNKAHGSSYALIAYQTAYVKANYPLEYMTALLTCETGNMDKVVEGIHECENLGITVLPPDVNGSMNEFTAIKENTAQTARIGGIRFGLGAIKHLGTNVIDEIIKNREANGHFNQIEDFLTKITAINKKALEALIRAGALDCFGNRNVLDYNIEAMLEFAKLARHEKESPMESLFENQRYARKLILKEPPASRIYATLPYEKEYLGLYSSSHPLAVYKPYIQKLGVTAIRDIMEEEAADGVQIRILGIITGETIIKTKKGESMLFATVEDTSGSIEIIVFPQLFQAESQVLRKDTTICVDGIISTKDEQIKIIVRKVRKVTEKSVEAWLQHAQTHTPIKLDAKNDSFYVTVPSKISKSMLHSLKGIMTEHPGGTPVYLRIDEKNVRILETKMKVAVTPLLEEKIKMMLQGR